jgi:23S rRNA (guanosine2251-2'-O)-methyltransferase
MTRQRITRRRSLSCLAERVGKKQGRSEGWPKSLQSKRANFVSGIRYVNMLCLSEPPGKGFYLTLMDVVFGIHAVETLLRSRSRPVERLHVAQGSRSTRLQGILGLARDQSVALRFEKNFTLDRLARSKAHQGVVAICGAKKYASLGEVLALKGDPAFFVVLDQVEDPHNLGAVVRTAACAGADGILITERRAVGLTPTVAKAASGALELVPVVRIGNLVQTLEDLKKANIWIIGVEADATMGWTEVDLTLPVALVFGSEGEGIRRLVREHCDWTVSLPLQRLGVIASLNVSVAAGILMYEVVRQRRKKKSQKQPTATPR